jgi:hypothetical protein
MPKVKKSASETKNAEINYPRPLVNSSLYPFFDCPRSRVRGCPSEPVTNKLQPSAVPLFKQLVGAQRDGVSVDSASLLQRQYDDEFGVVDPASDIHSDPHLLQDALIRRTMESQNVE